MSDTKGMANITDHDSDLTCRIKDDGDPNIVNIEHISSINAKDVLIGQKRIPITKDFKDFLMKTMNS